MQEDAKKLEKENTKKEVSKILDDMHKYGHINDLQRSQFLGEAGRVVELYNGGSRNYRNVALASISIVADAAKQGGYGIKLGRLWVGTVPYFSDFYGDEISTRAVRAAHNEILSQARTNFGHRRELIYNIPERKKLFFKN